MIFEHYLKPAVANWLVNPYQNMFLASSYWEVYLRSIAIYPKTIFIKSTYTITIRNPMVDEFSSKTKLVKIRLMATYPVARLHCPGTRQSLPNKSIARP